MIALVLPDRRPWAAPLAAALGATILSPPAALVAAMFRLAGADAPRRIRATLALRKAWDRLAARQLGPDLRAVIAPTLGARACLALARERGVPGVLVDDLPDLATLQRALDAAATSHPSCLLLRRHRADHQVLAGQRAERILATVRLGGELPVPVPTSPTLRLGDGLLLAGVPIARSGAVEALAAAERLGRPLLVRRSQVLEPGVLAHHPLVRVVDRPTEAAVVLAPSWVPSRPWELLAAARAGIPTVASTTATSPGPVGRRVEAGDIDGLVDAIESSVPRAPWTGDPNATTLDALERLLGLP